MHSTKQLCYPFNTIANLEVQIKETWYRVTPCDFRSFNGPRRINGLEYSGPIYYKKTNDVVKKDKLTPLINYPIDYNPVGINNNNIRRRF
jgi:hypothetical protein